MTIGAVSYTHLLSTLSEQTRRAFILSRFENKPNKEIAEEMELSIKGVEYHISKARCVSETAFDSDSFVKRV